MGKVTVIEVAGDCRIETVFQSLEDYKEIHGQKDLDEWFTDEEECEKTGKPLDEVEYWLGDVTEACCALGLSDPNTWSMFHDQLAKLHRMGWLKRPS